MAENTISLPKGIITMWSGSIVDIPLGWALCDGANGTPDLRDKFIKGVLSSTTNPGVTGGTATVTLNITQIPSHQHTISASGTHTHPTVIGGDLESGPNTYGVGNMGVAVTGAGGDHTHGGNTGLIGDGGSHENRPPYYELAFIMKL